MAKSNVDCVKDMLERQWNQRDITAVDDYIAEDHVDHRPMPGQKQGRAGVRALIEEAMGRVVRVEIHECFGDRDMVATRYTLHMIHHGEVRGVSVEGKATETHIVAMDRLRDGQIIESWGEYDSLRSVEELGGLPEGFSLSR